MSLNVLVLMEDHTKDQLIALPIMQKMFEQLGKPNARILCPKGPSFGGVSQALKWERIKEVLNEYPMVQLFMLLVDRDGEKNRRQSLDRLEQQASEILGEKRTLIAENAWQEIEVWALAGQKLPKDWNWKEIRAEVHPKERYFEPWAKERGLTFEPGQGRTTMGREAAVNYSSVRSKCKEDTQSLEKRVKNGLAKIA